MAKKKYSIASHLIHSRLEMVRNRLRIKENSHAANMAVDYSALLEYAAQSILIEHGIKCEYKDKFDALEMFYNATYPKPSANALKYYAVEHSDAQTGIKTLVKGWNRETGGIFPADLRERLTKEEADKRYKEMGTGQLLCFGVIVKYEDPEIRG